MWPGACREDPKKEVMKLFKLFKCHICKIEERNRFHLATRGSRVCSFSENSVGWSKGYLNTCLERTLPQRLFLPSLAPNTWQRLLWTQMCSALSLEMVPMYREYTVCVSPDLCPQCGSLIFSAVCVAYSDTSFNEASFFWPHPAFSYEISLLLLLLNARSLPLGVLCSRMGLGCYSVV